MTEFRLTTDASGLYREATGQNLARIVSSGDVPSWLENTGGDPLTADNSIPVLVIDSIEPLAEIIIEPTH